MRIDQQAILDQLFPNRLPDVSLPTSVDSLEMFERAWTNIAARLEDANLALKLMNDTQRKAIAEAELAGGTRGSADRSTEILQQEQLRSKVQATRMAIQQMRAELTANDSDTVRVNFGVTDATGPAELKALSERATGPKEKAVLQRMAELKTLEAEVVEFEADLAEAQVAAKRRLTDLTKQVDEFYRGIQRQAAEAVLDAKAITREIAGNNAKARLKSSLKGLQDNYISEFVDSLINLVDSLNEPFKMAIEANRQIMQRRNSLEDALLQGQELSRQLPTGFEGMGSAAAGGTYGANVAGLDNTIRVVRTGKKDQYGGEELQVQLIKGGRVVATEKAASGVRSNQRFEVAGRNTQKAGSLAPIPEGSYKIGTPEFGSFGSRIGKTWIDILDPNTGSSSIGGTGRGAFGFHEDANRFSGSPGSAGCVVFYDAAATKRVADWVKGGARKLQVDWGLGTFSQGIQPPQNATVPSPRSVAGAMNLTLGLNAEGKRMAAYLNNPNVRAMLDAVARAEGLEGKPGGGYDLGFGYRKISSLKAHPYHGRELTPGGSSSASGRYQFMGHTWSDMSSALGLKDFSPIAQDIAAIKLLDRRGVLGSVAAGKINESVLNKLAPEWASIEYGAGSGRGYYPGQLTDKGRQANLMPYFRNRVQAYAQGGPAPGVMMPTTGMTQGQVERYEFDAKEFGQLQNTVDSATRVATGTTHIEIDNIKKLVQSQIALKDAENLQAIRKAKRQLVMGGREQERGNRGIVEQLQDIEASIGDDTALKSVKNDIASKRREARDYKERLRDSIEKTESSLVDAESLIELIQSGAMPEQFNQFLPELQKQRASIQGQLQKLRAADAQVDKTFGKAIADLERKYKVDLLDRTFERDQKLSAEQMASAKAEMEQLRTKVEQPYTTPEDKQVAQVRIARLDRYTRTTEVKNEEAQKKQELDKLARAQPDVYTPERVAEQIRFIEEAAKRKLQAIANEYQKTVKDLDYDLAVKEMERARESMRRSIDQLREQARDLQVQAKDERLLTGNPLKALDLQKQSFEKAYEADLQALQLGAEEFNQQQEDLVRSSQRTREAAEQAKQEFERLNQVKLSNLKLELEQNTAELSRQREEIEYQSKARIFDADQQLGAAQVQKLREFDGRGIEALDLQQKIDLGRVEFDLTAKLRELDLDKTITPEAKEQIRDRLTNIATMQRDDITIKADLAREDNEFQSKTLQFQSVMNLNSARGNYAKAFGFEGRDFDKASAIAQEQYNLAEGLRRIDEQARNLGLAPEIVGQLKQQLQDLNQVNLQAINAQFNPLVEGLKSVKGAFQGFLGDIISGNESIGDAFNKMVDNILNSLSALAAQLITEQLFGSLFGLNKGVGAAAGGGGGGLGGIFSMIFGFADGGPVPAMDHSDLRKRPDAIGQALRQEGPNSVLAALTPGERVLTIPERIEYERMQRLLNPRAALAVASQSERLQRIYNFNAGGVVPGGPTVAPGSAAGIGNTNVNVPIDINAEGSAQPGRIDPNRLRDAIRSAVIDELRRQRRPRGELY